MMFDAPLMRKPPEVVKKPARLTSSTRDEALKVSAEHRNRGEAGGEQAGRGGMMGESKKGRRERESL